jgi:signal transduction histidine kinase
MEDTMSSLSDSQKKFYEEALQQTKKEIQEIEGQIQEELAKVKQKIADLQSGQKAARQMYDAACQRLGIPNDLEEEQSSSG